MFHDNQLQKKSNTRINITIAALIAGLICVILLMVWSTSELNKLLRNSTADYLQNMSNHMSAEISADIDREAALLAEAASSMPKENRGKMSTSLHKAYGKLDFDEMAVMDENGTVLAAEGSARELEPLTGRRFEAAQPKVMYTKRENLLFSVPLDKGETDGQHGNRNYILVGIHSKEKIPKLVSLNSFAGKKGFVCIADRRGIPVITSGSEAKNPLFGGKNHGAKLNVIFQTKKEERGLREAIKAQGDLQSMQFGICNFISEDGVKATLAYQNLAVDGWMLLAALPEGQVVSAANGYLNRISGLTNGLVLAFIVFLIIAVRYHGKSRKDLEKIAFTDPLTGGMNNAAFLIASQSKAESAYPYAYTIVLLNIKGFKVLNEHLGISGGNQILKDTYAALRANIYGGELVARDEADAFFLLLKDNNRASIQIRLNDMIQAVNRSVARNAANVHIYMRQGACPVEDPDLDIRIFQDHARVAAQERNSDVKCAYYHVGLMEQMLKEHEIKTLFANSIRDGDFQVYLQPKVRLSDNVVCGAEALVRWIHPEKGVILPSDFIPLLEQNEKICQLDRYIFEQVCIWMNRKMQNNERLLPVSINLSRIHFKEPDFLKDYIRIKEKYDIPDNLLELEITESVFFDTHQRALIKRAIEEMHEYGFLCSLDDFGAGFSSLALLKEFDVDTLKLDKLFFDDIENEKAQHVISSLIGLAGDLGMKVVAEGIESERQAEYLRGLRCDTVQGYLFSKPLSLSAFEEWNRMFTAESRAS